MAEQGDYEWFDIPLDSPLERNTEDAICDVRKPTFAYNSQQLVGGVMHNSLRYEDQGVMADWYRHRFTLETVSDVLQQWPYQLQLNEIIALNGKGYTITESRWWFTLTKPGANEVSRGTLGAITRIGDIVTVTGTTTGGAPVDVQIPVYLGNATGAVVPYRIGFKRSKRNCLWELSYVWEELKDLVFGVSKVISPLPLVSKLVSWTRLTSTSQNTVVIETDSSVGLPNLQISFNDNFTTNTTNWTALKCQVQGTPTRIGIGLDEEFRWVVKNLATVEVELGLTAELKNYRISQVKLGASKTVSDPEVTLTSECRLLSYLSWALCLQPVTILLETEFDVSVVGTYNPEETGVLPTGEASQWSQVQGLLKGVSRTVNSIVKDELMVETPTWDVPTTRGWWRFRTTTNPQPSPEDAKYVGSTRDLGDYTQIRVVNPKYWEFKSPAGQVLARYLIDATVVFGAPNESVYGVSKYTPNSESWEFTAVYGWTRHIFMNLDNLVPPSGYTKEYMVPLVRAQMNPACDTQPLQDPITWGSSGSVVGALTPITSWKAVKKDASGNWAYMDDSDLGWSVVSAQSGIVCISDHVVGRNSKCNYKMLITASNLGNPGENVEQWNFEKYEGDLFTPTVNGLEGWSWPGEVEGSEDSLPSSTSSGESSEVPDKSTYIKATITTRTQVAVPNPGGSALAPWPTIQEKIIEHYQGRDYIFESLYWIGPFSLGSTGSQVSLGVLGRLVIGQPTSAPGFQLKEGADKSEYLGEPRYYLGQELSKPDYKVSLDFTISTQTITSEWDLVEYKNGDIVTNPAKYVFLNTTSSPNTPLLVTYSSEVKCSFKVDRDTGKYTVVAGSVKFKVEDTSLYTYAVQRPLLIVGTPEITWDEFRYSNGDHIMRGDNLLGGGRVELKYSNSGLVVVTPSDALTVALLGLENNRQLNLTQNLGDGFEVAFNPPGVVAGSEPRVEAWWSGNVVRFSYMGTEGSVTWSGAFVSVVQDELKDIRTGQITKLRLGNANELGVALVTSRSDNLEHKNFYYLDEHHILEEWEDVVKVMELVNFERQVDAVEISRVTTLKFREPLEKLFVTSTQGTKPHLLLFTAERKSVLTIKVGTVPNNWDLNNIAWGTASVQFKCLKTGAYEAGKINVYGREEIDASELVVKEETITCFSASPGRVIVGFAFTTGINQWTVELTGGGSSWSVGTVWNGFGYVGPNGLLTGSCIPLGFYGGGVFRQPIQAPQTTMGETDTGSLLVPKIVGVGDTLSFIAQSATGLIIAIDAVSGQNKVVGCENNASGFSTSIVNDWWNSSKNVWAWGKPTQLNPATALLPIPVPAWKYMARCSLSSKSAAISAAWTNQWFSCLCSDSSLVAGVEVRRQVKEEGDIKYRFCKGLKINLGFSVSTGPGGGSGSVNASIGNDAGSVSLGGSGVIDPTTDMGKPNVEEGIGKAADAVFNEVLNNQVLQKEAMNAFKKMGFFGFVDDREPVFHSYRGLPPPTLGTSEKVTLDGMREKVRTWVRSNRPSTACPGYSASGSAAGWTFKDFFCISPKQAVSAGPGFTQVQLCAQSMVNMYGEGETNWDSFDLDYGIDYLEFGLGFFGGLAGIGAGGHLAANMYGDTVAGPYGHVDYLIWQPYSNIGKKSLYLNHPHYDNLNSGVRSTNISCAYDLNYSAKIPESGGQIDVIAPVLNSSVSQISLPPYTAYVEGIGAYLQSGSTSIPFRGDCGNPLWTQPHAFDYCIDRGNKLYLNSSGSGVLGVTIDDTMVLDGMYSNMVINPDNVLLASNYITMKLKQGVDSDFDLKPVVPTADGVLLNLTGGYNFVRQNTLYHACSGYTNRIGKLVGTDGTDKELSNQVYSTLGQETEFKVGSILPPLNYLGYFKAPPTVNYRWGVNFYSRFLDNEFEAQENINALRIAAPCTVDVAQRVPAYIRTKAAYELIVVDGVTSFCTGGRLTTPIKVPTEFDFVQWGDAYRQSADWISRVRNGLVEKKICGTVGLNYVGSTSKLSWFFGPSLREFFHFKGGDVMESVGNGFRFRDVRNGKWDLVAQEIVFKSELERNLRTLVKVDDEFLGTLDRPHVYMGDYDHYGLSCGLVVQSDGTETEGMEQCQVYRNVLHNYMLLSGMSILENLGKWKKVKGDNISDFFEDRVYDKENLPSGYLHNPFHLATTYYGLADNVECRFAWKLNFIINDLMRVIMKDSYVQVNICAETITVGGTVVSPVTHVYLTKELFTRSSDYNGYWTFVYYSENGLGSREKLYIWGDGLFGLEKFECGILECGKMRAAPALIRVDVHGKEEM